MFKVTSITVAAVLALAGAAAATDGTATTTLTPNKAGAATAATVTVSGLSAPTGVPSSVVLTVQKGFTSSVKAVPVLCSSSAATCPAGSQIGSGSITASALGQTLTAPVKLFLGPPQQPGDISSVIATGSADGIPLHAIGRVFTPAGGGLELSIDTSSLGSLPVTIQGVSLSAHATHTVIKKKTIVKRVGPPGHKHKKKIVKRTKVVYSVLTNPPTCNGTWTGSLTLNYASGPITLPLSTPCTS
jgi:hypothetical protein